MKRLFITFLALCTLLSLFACGKEEPAAKPTEVEETVTEETASTVPEKTQESVEGPWEQVYADLTADFKKLIEFRASEDFSENWYNKLAARDFSETAKRIVDAHTQEEIDSQLAATVTELITSEEQGVDSFGCIRYDLNKDGIPELFWVHDDHSIVALFTFVENEGVLLDSYWSRYQGYVSDEGVLYGWGSTGAAEGSCSVFALNEKGMLDVQRGLSSEIDLFGDPTQVNYYEFSGNAKKEVTKERFEELAEQYPREQSSLWLALPIEKLT